MFSELFDDVPGEIGALFLGEKRLESDIFLYDNSKETSLGKDPVLCNDIGESDRPAALILLLILLHVEFLPEFERHIWLSNSDFSCNVL